jgi:hypothetical protein
VQFPQHRRPPRHENEPGRLAVKTVNKFQGPILRIHRPERLDQPKTKTAAAVHRESRWLRQHQQIPVLVHQGSGDPFLPTRGCDGRDRRGQARQWRQAHDITLHETAIGFGTSLVDANLALAQGPINARLRNRRAMAQHEIVEALSIAPLVHVQPAHTAAAILTLWRRHGNGCSSFFYLSASGFCC